MLFRLKSPLRYPNDRRKSASIVAQIIPDNVNKITSPFFGGGGLEVNLINKGYKIDGHVDFKNLYEFWLCLLKNPYQLYNYAQHFYPIDDEDVFHLMQKKINEHDDVFLRAALFYVINRCTEEGTITSGKFMKNHPEFNEYFLQKLKLFNTNNLNIFHSQPFDAVQNCNDFMVCCPSSYRSQSYLEAAQLVFPERPSINHVELSRLLNKKNNWILLVNYHENLIDMYEPCQKVCLDENYNISNVNPSHILIFKESNNANI